MISEVLQILITQSASFPFFKIYEYKEECTLTETSIMPFEILLVLSLVSIIIIIKFQIHRCQKLKPKLIYLLLHYRLVLYKTPFHLYY